MTTVAHQLSETGSAFDPAAVEPLGGEVYGDAAVFSAERRRLFAPDSAGVYLGHDHLLPEAGHRRADGDPRLVLVRDGDQVHALANVCTHACRPIVHDDAPAPTTRLRCPYHDWSFRADGTLIGGPGMRPGPDDAGTLALASFPVVAWHGFRFAVAPERRERFEADLARIDDELSVRGIGDWLDLDGWSLVATHDDAYGCDWKMFMEVFGDCYHVPPFHPGLASFVDCGSIEWTFGESYHAQFLRLSADRGARSPRYGDWADGLDRYRAARGDAAPEMAVAWVAVYPNLMFEAYNGLKVLSVVVPDGPESFVNRVHFFVPDDVHELAPDLAATMCAAYDETVEEDRELVATRGDGMRAAAGLGLTMDRYRPMLTGRALEAGVAHFQDWWRRSMAAT